MPRTTAANLIEGLGARLLAMLSYAGSAAILLGRAARGAFRGLFTPKVSFGLSAFCQQLVRVGIKSIPIVVLVQTFIGVILALQMAPPLKPWGQVDKIADIIGIAGFRMLGPIITAVVLSGFAGASIAAELGTMVVAEEIEALEAMALNPVRYLVVPRILATFVAMILLTILADLMIGLGGYVASVLALGPEVSASYWDRLQSALRYRDLITGLIQAAVFGVLISLIACHEGLSVRGGAEGVGRATTMTVVYSIVAIVAAAGVFTVIFYTYEL